MKCANCNSYKNVKNGHAPSGKKRYKCKRCKKTFSEVSKKNYPATSVPFEFIALILHRTKNNSLGEIKTIVNSWLSLFKRKQLPICLKEEVSRSCIYKWRKQYGNIYAKLVPHKTATEYIHYHLDKIYSNDQLQIKKNPFDELNCDEITKHTETLKLIVKLFGKDNILDTNRKYPRVFDEYQKLFEVKVMKQKNKKKN